MPVSLSPDARGASENLPDAAPVDTHKDLSKASASPDAAIGTNATTIHTGRLQAREPSLPRVQVGLPRMRDPVPQRVGRWLSQAVLLGANVLRSLLPRFRETSLAASLNGAIKRNDWSYAATLSTWRNMSLQPEQLRAAAADCHDLPALKKILAAVQPEGDQAVSCLKAALEARNAVALAAMVDSHCLTADTVRRAAVPAAES